jgi:predicted dehydrogenase
MTGASNPNRRDFLKQSAAVAGAGLVAGIAQQRARAQAPSANEKIGVGAIGVGGMGSHHLGVLMNLKKEGLVDVVAVCDVYANRLEAAAKKTGGKPYKVWSDLLADKQVDAVLIATPDHWHAPLCIAAAEAGKDIYCEKPMTHWDQLDLARKVVEAVEKNKRVMQVGTQFISDDCWEIAKEKLGMLGKVVHVQSSDCRNGPIGCYSPKSNDPAVRPGENLDWEMWLGCDKTRVPHHAYEPGRFLAFRSFWDYSGGTGTDFFPHILTPWVKVLDLGFPKRVVTAGGRYFWDDGREVPDIVNTCIDYEGGPTVMLTASLATEQNLPWLIRGQKAAMTFASTPSSPVKIIPEKAAGNTGETIELKGKRRWSEEQHWRDLIRCIKTREMPRSNQLIGYRVMAALSMGIKSYRTGKAMGFDTQTETVKEL